MDESEKRRERLKAMRTEAAQAGASASSSAQVHAGGLANPLTEASPSHQETHSNARFDFYTDPMASYSANRRTRAASPAPRGFSPSPGYGGRPMPMTRPSPESWDPRASMHPADQFETNHLHNRTNYQARSFYYPPARLPCGTPLYSEYPCPPHPEFPPGVHSHFGPAFGNHLHSNLPMGANIPNFTMAQSGRNDFGHGQGRGQSFRGSHRGRGRGNWSNNNTRPQSRQSDNRDSQTPQSFYEKSMVEDPWKFLKPSPWGQAKSETSNIASLTVGMKRPFELAKPAVSNSQSLAEYLADSFGETVTRDSDA